jgi:two-component SAPR family response regulator
MSYNPYLWFTKQRKRKLPKSRPLLERIQNGDFEYSIYFQEAEQVRKEAEQVFNDVMKHALISDMKQREHEANLSAKMKRVRANKLMEEADKDEKRLLRELRDELEKEFGVDLWDKAMESQMGRGTTEDLYLWYKKEVGQTYTKSELQMRGLNVRN